MNTRTLILGLTMLVFSAVFGGDTKITHANAKEAAALVNSGKVTVVDVRSANEFAEGHIKGAKNIDILEEKTFEPQLNALDKNQPVLVHCEAGGRSTRSLKVFEKLGFKNVTHLDGGLKAWRAEGLPVKK